MGIAPADSIKNNNIITPASACGTLKSDGSAYLKQWHAENPYCTMKLSQAASNGSPKIAANIQMIYIFIVHDRKISKVILTREDLLKNPTIDIDGYIANMIVFCKDNMDMKVELNGNVLNRAKMSEGDMILEQVIAGQKGSETVQLRHLSPKTMAAGKYDESYFNGLLSRKTELLNKGEFPTLKGVYYLNLCDEKWEEYLGTPATDKEINTLAFSDWFRRYSLTIRQKSYVNAGDVDLDPNSTIDDLSVEYLGADLEGFSKKVGLEEKKRKIAEGIYNVERIVNMDLFSRCNVIDYNVVNAFAEGRKRTITFLRSYLMDPETAEHIGSTAEHETLHILTNGIIAYKGKLISTLYADLKDYHGKEREGIIQDGTTPLEEWVDEARHYPDKVFMYFINEKNYFFGGKTEGGHAQENIWEFSTSFFHTLMYIEKLPENLKNEIFVDEQNVPDNKVALTETDKRTILDDYIKTIEMFKAIGYNLELTAFLEQKLAYVKALRTAME